MLRRLAFGLLAGRPPLDGGSSFRAAAHHGHHPREGPSRDLRRRHTDL